MVYFSIIVEINLIDLNRFVINEFGFNVIVVINLILNLDLFIVDLFELVRFVLVVILEWIIFVLVMILN